MTTLFEEWLASAGRSTAPLRDAEEKAHPWTDLTISDGKVLVCEASDLRLSPSDPGWLSLVREEAPVLGVAVRGKEGSAWFHLEEVERDRDGDVTCWVLRPVPEHVRLFPGLRGWCLRVYND